MPRLVVGVATCGVRECGRSSTILVEDPSRWQDTRNGAGGVGGEELEDILRNILFEWKFRGYCWGRMLFEG
jgi:hypothetical protein